MAKRLVRRHPYDTNDYEDLPDGVVIDIIVTYQDRINAECMNPHHCTIANAISRQADTVGIFDLGRRGVSRRFVAMLLDPNVYSWAKAGQWYRGRLTDTSAELTIELDQLALSPNMQAETRRSLQKAVKGLPLGDLTEWTVVTITAPFPSEKKGYRQGANIRGRSGQGTKPVQGIPRRQWQPTAKGRAAS